MIPRYIKSFSPGFSNLEVGLQCFRGISGPLAPLDMEASWGVSSGIDQCTEVSKLLVGLLEAASPGAVCNTISVSSDCCQAPHRDTNNMISIPNRLVPLVMPKSGGDLWVEIWQGDELLGEVVVKEVQPGKQVAGQFRAIVQIERRPCSVLSAQRAYGLRGSNYG